MLFCFRVDQFHKHTTTKHRLKYKNKNCNKKIQQLQALLSTKEEVLLVDLYNDVTNIELALKYVWSKWILIAFSEIFTDCLH